MGLVEYKRKRRLGETPEPAGGKASGSKLQFVVQKHHASRLHYDFRIELRGVLVSWAVPKGPSLNPAEKRLAMKVEDHPFDYKDFEGVIPEGNYGAGTVIIWDKGTYEPLEPAKSKVAREKQVSAGLHKGSLKIRLNGEKLRGEFALVETKSRGDNSWLLIKHRDEFATDESIAEAEESVVSGKTLEEVASDTTSKKWRSNRQTNMKTSTKSPQRSGRKKSKPTASEPDFGALLKPVQKKKKAPMPADVKPMLATLVEDAFDESGWLYEVKWDGYRAISYVDKGQVQIRSRNNKDFNKKFYPVREALEDWKVRAVVDGEIVVLNAKGEPDFEALQQWRSEADGELIYYLFDLIWLEGYDLMGVPLSARKKLLQEIVPDAGIIRFSDTFDVTGKEFFVQADNLGLEGIMAKKENSPYQPDARGKDWLKIKTQKHQEAVIGGYTLNENSRKKFSALLLGVFENKKFRFIGPVGTGFDASDQTEIMKRLSGLETKVCPFSEVPDYNKPSRFRPNPPKAEVVWVKPEVVVEISYRELSRDGSLRHPSYRGIREDKKSTDVKMEKPVSVEEVSNEVVEKKGKASGKKIISPLGKTDRKTLLNPTDETQVRKINGHELKFTNLSKVYWPDEGYTKRDMLNYYYQIAEVMLPYMKDRPQTLNRFPNGIKGKSFYQKDVTGKVPDWIDTYPYFAEGDETEKNFLVCTNEETLLYIASLGCIEINPWSSRTKYPDNPDWCIIDLDPDEKNTFNQVIEAAQVTRKVLDALGIPSWCKTSGSTGIHIYLPLQAKYTYEESKEFGRALVKIVNRELPAFTSIERKVSDRKGKMYLDFLQNRPQATIAGPYSLRPKPGAPVSMPLHWDEVKKGLRMLDFNITNAVARVRSEGDLFAGLLEQSFDLHKAMVTLVKTFGKINE